MKIVHLQADWTKEKKPNCNQKGKLPNVTRVIEEVTCEKCKLKVNAINFFNTSLKCQCGCGNNAQVIHTDLYSNCRYILCKNCEINFVTLSMDRQQFQSMIKNGHSPKEFMLHEDFYDEKGDALQPMFQG